MQVEKWRRTIHLIVLAVFLFPGSSLNMISIPVRDPLPVVWHGPVHSATSLFYLLTPTTFSCLC